MRLPWGGAKAEAAEPCRAQEHQKVGAEQTSEQTAEEEAGRVAKTSTLGSCWSATPGVVLRRIPLAAGKEVEGSKHARDSSDSLGNNPGQRLWWLGLGHRGGKWLKRHPSSP